MSKYGLVKTLQTDDGQSIKLVGNALTFIIYKSYFGRDLLNDILAFAGKNADAKTIAKFQKLEIKTVDDIAELTDDEQKELFASITDFNFDSEFVLNFITALIATARYPEKLDIIDIITEVPPYWIADRDIIGELLEFLSLFITQKKR